MNISKIGLSTVVLISLSSLVYAAPPVKKETGFIVTCPSPKQIIFTYKIKHPEGFEVDSKFETVEFKNGPITHMDVDTPAGKVVEVTCNYTEVNKPSNIVELSVMLPEGLTLPGTCKIMGQAVMCQ